MSRAYQYILFDLDGTLLPLTVEDFMQRYVPALYDFMAARGKDAGVVVDAVFGATRAMAEHPDQTNEKCFWDAFEPLIEAPREEYEPLMLDFYLSDFDKVKGGTVPDQNMVDAVATLKAKGYPMAVATMPMFPLEAVQTRLGWAGLNPDDFEFITTYSNSTALKPRTEYYNHVFEMAGHKPGDMLMVGNNTLEDGVTARLGCNLYLVTDHLIVQDGGVDLERFPHGTSTDFLAFCQALPE
ncbi:HAD family hydrolase [Slackia heliotrinireducens]|uniref:HAD family hydrolase n=1 Tax=Slackia heliotrinireducens TaxID=84110 RepID=UPI0033151D6A